MLKLWTTSKLETDAVYSNSKMNCNRPDKDQNHSKLQIVLVCSIRILSRTQDILKKKTPVNSDFYKRIIPFNPYGSVISHTAIDRSLEHVTIIPL